MTSAAGVNRKIRVTPTYCWNWRTSSSCASWRGKERAMSDNNGKTISFSRACPPHCKGAPQQPCVWTQSAWGEWKPGCNPQVHEDFYVRKYKPCPYWRG